MLMLFISIMTFHRKTVFFAGKIEIFAFKMALGEIFKIFEWQF